MNQARELAMDAERPVYDCRYLALAIVRQTAVPNHDKGFTGATERLGLGERMELRG